jgi:integrase/recombinase XerD
MDKTAMLGPWVRRFLLEHLVGERNLAANTQRSYRDTLVLLLPFVAQKVGKAVDRLSVVDLSAELIRLFLTELESTRGCAIVTRNQRLAAIHALARFVGEHSPEHVDWCAQLRAIPFKKPAARAVVPYLDKAEMQALLAAPDQQTAQRRRDHALLLFLYNSGARAQEAAGLRIADLELRASCVTLLGKGSKKRQCPLWPVTVRVLSVLTAGRLPSDPVFLNRCGRALTRFGIHTLVERYAAKVQSTVPSLAKKRVSPHTLRHTTATHLLRAGVDINTIRAWLGHVSLNTTNVYAEIDLEMKAKALAACEVAVAGGAKSEKRWRQDPQLMSFLRSL